MERLPDILQFLSHELGLHEVYKLCLVHNRLSNSHRPLRPVWEDCKVLRRVISPYSERKANIVGNVF
jgi:hypothetical protein